MGLFDKIKDNAKSISIKAIDAAQDDPSPQINVMDTAAISTKAPFRAVSGDADFEDLQDLNDSLFTNTEESELATDTKEPAEKQDSNEKSVKQDLQTGPAKTDTVRRSKVTEMSKEEHAKLEKAKKQEKTKQEAKERLAKSYVPSYKTAKPEAEVSEKSANKPQSAKPTRTVSAQKSIGIIDVTPNKPPTTAKDVSFARERAAITALASQRKLNGAVAMYSSSHMNFKVKVYINRIEYSGSFGKSVIDINKIAWIKLRHGGTGIILETTEGKKNVMVVKPADRLAFTDAILKVQALQPKRKQFKDTQTVRIDHLEKISEGVDEIEKLAKLYDKGILSQDEFETKKKQILGL